MCLDVPTSISLISLISDACIALFSYVSVCLHIILIIKFAALSEELLFLYHSHCRTVTHKHISGLARDETYISV